MECGCVGDQPQRLQSFEFLGNSRVLRLVDDDTAAFRDFQNTLLQSTSRGDLLRDCFRLCVGIERDPFDSKLVTEPGHLSFGILTRLLPHQRNRL